MPFSHFSYLRRALRCVTANLQEHRAKPIGPAAKTPTAALAPALSSTPAPRTPTTVCARTPFSKWCRAATAITASARRCRLSGARSSPACTAAAAAVTAGGGVDAGEAGGAALAATAPCWSPRCVCRRGRARPAVRGRSGGWLAQGVGASLVAQRLARRALARWPGKWTACCADAVNWVPSGVGRVRSRDTPC